MKITVFGGTGSLGREVLKQCLDAGHEITALMRTPDKLPQSERSRMTIVQGDGLVAKDVASALPVGTHAILFAIGVDEKYSPPDLSTDITRHILNEMDGKSTPRLIWCGGGSNIRPEDEVTFGARIVHWFAQTFLNHRHMDKEHQLELLDANADLCWMGVRPLQMKAGPLTGQYRLGYNRFNGMSRISFADCAHAMMCMLEDDAWVGKVPIVQY
jgi:putative NADH-flavin reductase